MTEYVWSQFFFFEIGLKYLTGNKVSAGITLILLMEMSHNINYHYINWHYFFIGSLKVFLSDMTQNRNTRRFHKIFKGSA